MLTNNLEEKISTVSEEKLKALQERGRAILEARRKHVQPALYTAMSVSMQEQHKPQEHIQPSKMQMSIEQTGLEASNLSKQALSNPKQVDELQTVKMMPTTTMSEVNAKHQESIVMKESTESSEDMIPKAEVEKMRTELVDKFNKHLAQCESDNKLYWEQVAATHAEDIAAVEAERDQYKALYEQLKARELEVAAESTQTIHQLNEENAKLLKELEEAKTANNELLAEIVRAKGQLQEQSVELEETRTKLLMLLQAQIDKSFANLIDDETLQREAAELSLELQITTMVNELEKQITIMTKEKCEYMEKNSQNQIDELETQLQEISSSLNESENIRKMLEEDASELKRIVDEEQATNDKLRQENDDLRERLHETELIIATHVHNTNTTIINDENNNNNNAGSAIKEFNPFEENANHFNIVNKEQDIQDHNSVIVDIAADHNNNDNTTIITTLNNEEQVKPVKYETVSNPFADDEVDDNTDYNNNEIDFATINESGPMRKSDNEVDNIDEHNFAANNRQENNNVTVTELRNEADNDKYIDKSDIQERKMLYCEIDTLRAELEESMRQLQIANDEVQRLNEELHRECHIKKLELTEQELQNEAIDVVDNEDVDVVNEKDNVDVHVVSANVNQNVYELPESTNYHDDQAMEVDNPFLDEDDTQELPLHTNKVIEVGEGALESDELT